MEEPNYSACGGFIPCKNKVALKLIFCTKRVTENQLITDYSTQKPSKRGRECGPEHSQLMPRAAACFIRPPRRQMALEACMTSSYTEVQPLDLQLNRRLYFGDLIVTIRLPGPSPTLLPQATSFKSPLKPPPGQATLLQRGPKISLFSEPTRLH